MLSLGKKADSLVVSYVLLISITMAIAGLAYTWLKFQGDISSPEECPEGVSLFISDYSLNNPLTEMNITLLNRGRFNIKGFFLRVNNETNFESGTLNVNKFNILLKPDEEEKIHLNQTNYGVNISSFERICFIEVQPFISSSKNEMILCLQKSTKKIPC